jgi:hypothetical protein
MKHFLKGSWAYGRMACQHYDRIEFGQQLVVENAMLSGFFKYPHSVTDCSEAFANGAGLIPRLFWSVGDLSSLQWTVTIYRFIPVTSFVDNFPIFDVFFCLRIANKRERI